MMFLGSPPTQQSLQLFLKGDKQIQHLQNQTYQISLQTNFLDL